MIRRNRLGSSGPSLCLRRPDDRRGHATTARTRRVPVFVRQATHRTLAHTWSVPPRTFRADHGRMAQLKPHRRKPIERRRPVGAAPLDLYDYVPAAGSQKRHRRSAERRICITDDWPEIVPITEAEVRIVEAYFGDVLDELFGPLL